MSWSPLHARMAEEEMERLRVTTTRRRELDPLASCHVLEAAQLGVVLDLHDDLHDDKHTRGYERAEHREDEDRREQRVVDNVAICSIDIFS